MPEGITTEKAKKKKQSGSSEIAESQPLVVEPDKSKSVLESFRTYLVKTAKTFTTVKSYVGDITDYLKFIKADIASSEGVLDRESIGAFRVAMIETTCRAATINTKLNSLLSYNRFLIEVGCMNDLVVDTKADRLTNEKLRKIRDAARGN